MHRQLARILDTLGSASRRLDRLVETTTEEAWHRAPAPDAWSATQCLMHLSMSTEAYREPLERALEEARRRAGGTAYRGRYRCDVLGWILSRVVGPTPRIGGKRRGRVNAPPAFHPTDDPPRATALEEFRGLQDELQGWVRACDGLPIQRVKVASVFVPSVRFNLYATLLILARHQHRHLQQAEEAAGVTP